jgi:hypothetical protein
VPDLRATLRAPSPMMESFTVALQMTGSMVLTTPLMSKFAQFSEHHWHGDGAFFLVNLVWYSAHFLPSFNFQSLLVCLVYTDSSVSTTIRHLLWFPIGRASGGCPFLAESIIGSHLFRFPLVWRNRWQASDMYQFCTVTTH